MTEKQNYTLTKPAFKNLKNMKLPVTLFFLGLVNIFFMQPASTMAQCTNCQGASSNPALASSAIGNMTKATGFTSFASGSYTFASGDYSSSMGSRCTADGDYSIVLGSNAAGNADRSIVIGQGFGENGQDRLVNTMPNSLMAGFNSIYPTLFISTSDSKFRTGRVGIGNVTNPQAKLHIRADQGEQIGLFLEKEDFRVADIFLGDDQHGIRSSDDYGLILRTEKNYVFDDGNVGIGTYRPEYKLDIRGSLFAKAFTLYDNDLYNENIAGWILRCDASGKAFWTDPSLFDDGDWVAKDDYVYRLNGNVGIGTSAPVAQLDIADVFPAGGLNLKVGNDAYITDIDRSHSLGIFSLSRPETGAVKLGSSGPVLSGMDSKLGIGTNEPVTTLELSSDLSTGQNTGLCLANANLHRWFIGMKGGGKDAHDLLIGNFSKLNAGYSEFLILKPGGQLGIGTNETFGYKLAVDGSILAEEVIVKVSENWPDYVFDAGYEPLPIAELQDFIRQNKHLPGIPNQDMISAEGLRLGEMECLLLKKIEELTLYIISQENKIEELETRVDLFSHLREFR